MLTTNVAPCVAVHVEETQVDRFRDRLGTLHAHARVVAVCSPLIYVQCNDKNHKLLASIRHVYGHGRIRAHRMYQLDHACRDPHWIPLSSAIQTLSKSSVVVRVVAFPHSLQAKMTQLLADHGVQTHPTQHSHELHVVYQPSLSPYFHFGIIERPNDPNNHHPADVAVASEAPCRAFFKMQESLTLLHRPLQPGDSVLDIGASPGGWTECLIRHGAHVVAVDPGRLTIPMANRPIKHIQLLLEDAMPQLEATKRRFTLCVCDINMRVHQMAALIAQVVHLLTPNAQIVLTLKLGKKPTAEAVERAVQHAKRILAPWFHGFRVVWLHANTQNERTLLAVKNH